MLHSVNFKNIMQFQEIDKALIQTTKSNKEDSIQLWRGENKKYYLICRKHKIVIP